MMLDACSVMRDVRLSMITRSRVTVHESFTRHSSISMSVSAR